MTQFSAHGGGSLSIRPAMPADLDFVFACIVELAASVGLSDECEAGRDDIAAALFGAQPRVFCDIAEWTRPNDAPAAAPEAAGCAVWHYNFSSFRGRHGLYLEDLYVRPALRRHGIGEALLRHLARRCVREGLARFEWRVVQWNPAIAFYRAHGAEFLDDWRICRVSGAALDRLGGHHGA